jgi:thioredoxin-related protein
MFLSTFVAMLALQAPAAKPPAKPAPAPAPAPAAPAPKSESKSAGDRWIGDFDQATEIARKKGKDLLVDFTGSDWCIWCQKLHKEVFEFDSFLDAAEKDYVLVALDYPRSEEAKKKVPNPTRNAELAQKYRIGGYPTVLLMTAGGDAYAKTGYQEGGPEKYVEDMKALAEGGKKDLAEINAFAAKADAAKAPDKPKLVEEAIARLGKLPDDSPFVAKVAAVVSAAYTIDADNKAGLKMKAVEAMLKAGQTDAATIAAGKALDPKNANGLLERIVGADLASIRSKEQIAPWVQTLDDLLAAGPFKDVKIGKQLLANATVMSKQYLNDLAKAKVYATKLKELGLDGPDDERLKQLVESIHTASG